MKRKLFWILAIVLAWFGRDGARGQQKTPVESMQEDCGVNFSFTAASSGAQATNWISGSPPAGSAGTSLVVDNRQVGCLDWIVTYNNTGFSALSLLFQAAPNSNGAPGTWAAYGGTINTGINPNTATTSAATDLTGAPYPFLRMNLTAATGSGVVSGKLYGWKKRPANVSVSGGTIIATLSSVASAQADASTNTPRVLADGSSNAMTNPTYGFYLNGTGTWDRARGNTLGAFVQGNTIYGSPVTLGTFRPNLIGFLAGGAAYTPSASANGGFPVASATILFAGADGLANNFRVQEDAVVAGSVKYPVFPWVYNESSWDRIRGNTFGVFAQGPAAQAAAAAGNPQRMGGWNGTNVYTFRTSTDGVLATVATSAGADAFANSDMALNIGNNSGIKMPQFGMYYLNGTGSWDRARGNTLGAIVQGAGTAGAGAGGVQTIQGDAAGTPVPVTLSSLVACTLNQSLNMTTATTTQIVAASGSNKIYICSYAMEAGGTTTGTIVYGTGSDCGSGTTALSAAYEWTAQTGIARGSGLGTIMRTPASQALCITNSQAVNLHVDVSYAYAP